MNKGYFENKSDLKNVFVFGIELWISFIDLSFFKSEFVIFFFTFIEVIFK